MAIRLEQLAELVDGTLIGDSTTQCTGANPPGDATSSEITMLVDPTQIGMIADTAAYAIVTSQEIDCGNRVQIVVEDPHEAFAKIVSHFRPPVNVALPGVGVDSSAVIAPSAKVHPTATIGAGTVIGERSVIMPGVVLMPKCVVGDDCVLHANVTLYEYTELGDRVVLHAGTVVGAYGFGYRQQGGRHVPTAQLGYVRIESDVETGAGVTIDRGTYGATRIGEGTKIDNQVMIAHNCQIGRHNILCSQVGVAGSCRTGDYVILAGQVGLKDHITLDDNVVVAAQSGVMHDIAAGEAHMGTPAMPLKEFMQMVAIQRRLPSLRRELKSLRRDLDQQLANDGSSVLKDSDPQGTQSQPDDQKRAA